MTTPDVGGPEFKDRRAEFARLARAVAATAEFSALVHDEAAAVHERLANPQLDPAALRAHAEEDRRWAERERQAASQVDQPLRADRADDDEG